MKIFSSLFHSRDKPKNSTAGSAYRFYMGGSTAGKNVTERSAMQMTAVYSCVRALSEAVAGLPLHVYKYRSDGGKEKAIAHSLYRLLHDEPNPEMTSFVFRETLMTPCSSGATHTRRLSATERARSLLCIRLCRTECRLIGILTERCTTNTTVAQMKQSAARNMR